MDLDDVYGLFFIGIFVLLLVLVVNFLLSSYDSDYELFWSVRDLENRAQVWAGRTINVSSVSVPSGVGLVDLENGVYYNNSVMSFSQSISYPVILLVDGAYHAGRVMVW